MSGRIRHFGIVVVDIEQSISFYSIFGFKVEKMLMNREIFVRRFCLLKAHI